VTTEETTAEQRIAGMRQIEAEVHACFACPLAQTRTNVVPGHGDYLSVVLLVGEGPGFEEDKQGKPFVGRSGQYLTESLARVGVRRDAVFVTNIVKCRPPDNRDPEPTEISACSTFLTRQLALVNPRIVVTLGRHSMGRWLPGASITKVHGQVKNIGHGRVVLPMYHPAAALRNPVWKAEFERDMEALPRLIERAVKANEAAARGEALPAGAPHPGDPDYHELDAGRDEVSAQEAATAIQEVNGLREVDRLPDVNGLRDAEAPRDTAAPPPDADDGDLRQLRLL
jgi:uracil-DNA glycosylase